MIINFSDLSIIEDEFIDKIFIEGTDRLYGESYNHFNNPKSLIVFKENSVELFSNFTYSVGEVVTNYQSVQPTAMDFYEGDGMDEVHFNPGADRGPDPRALDWLGNFFNEISASKNTYNSVSNVFVPTNRGPNYQQIGFAYRVADILAKKFNNILNYNYTKEDIVNYFEFIITRAQMPWLNSIVSKEHRIQIKGRDDTYVAYCLGNDMNRNINKFFNDFKIKPNKRLKKVIFSQVYVKVVKKETYNHKTLISDSSLPFLRIKGANYTNKTVLPDGTIEWSIEDHYVNASIFKDVVWMSKCLPVDCICDILEDNTKYSDRHEDYFVVSNIDMTSQFLNLMSLPKRKRLITESRGQHLLRDTINQWSQYNEAGTVPKKLMDKYPNGIHIPKFQTVKELHDKISKQFNEIKAEEKNRELEYTEDEMKLHNAEIDGVRLVLPSEGSVVVGWGKELHHCIASYIDRAAQKEIMLLGVFVDDKLTYNIEMRYYDETDLGQRSTKQLLAKRIKDMKKPIYKIHQMRGLSNCSATPEHSQTVNKIFKEWISSLVSENTEQTMQSDLSQAQ